jgi:hypothetical protein
MDNLQTIFESIIQNNKFILSGLPKGVHVLQSNSTVVLCKYLNLPYWVSLSISGRVTVKPYIGVFTNANI